MYQLKVNLSVGPSFTSWTNGELWNGWQCPRFEKAQADEIVEYFNSVAMGDLGLPTGRYDAEQDAYILINEEAPDEPDVYKGFDLDGKHLYAIGAWGWTWELTSE